MPSRSPHPRLARTPLSIAALAALTPLAALSATACASEPPPPPRVAHESAAAQVQRVSKRWGDTVEESGFLQNDPNGVLQFKVTTERAFTLDGRKVHVHVERTETFQTTLGAFRCKARGDVDGTATYAWQAGDPEVRVDLPAASLPRMCTPPGFPVSAKALPDSTHLFVLESDRLVGKTNARDRTILLPLQ